MAWRKSTTAPKYQCLDSRVRLPLVRYVHPILDYMYPSALSYQLQQKKSLELINKFKLHFILEVDSVLVRLVSSTVQYLANMNQQFQLPSVKDLVLLTCLKKVSDFGKPLSCSGVGTELTKLPLMARQIKQIHSMPLSQITRRIHNAKFVAARCMKPKRAIKPNFSTTTCVQKIKLK